MADVAALLDRGRERLGRGAWGEARAAFAEVLDSVDDPSAWEGLAFAARMLGDFDASFTGYERAYRLSRDAGDDTGAARAATWLGWNAVMLRGDLAMSRGWFARAHRLLDDQPVTVEHAWLAIREAEHALLHDQDADQGRRLAEQAAAAARHVGDVDSEHVAVCLIGLAMVYAGEVDQGMRRLDEAAVALMVGELSSLLATGLACCYLIFGCEQCLDVARAAEWCGAIRDRLCAELEIHQILAFCRCHYASVLMFRGQLGEADTELNAAEASFAAGAPAAAYEARLRRAELRRRQGRPDEARALAEQVSWHPDAIRCLAALALDDGDVVAAAELVDRHLRRIPGASRLARAPGVALSGVVNARAGRLSAAEAAVGELEGLAQTGPMRAMLASTQAEVAGAAGRHQVARRHWEDAIDGWHGLGAPYETAQARQGLARTLAALGRDRDAAEEQTRATNEFTRLTGGLAVARPRLSEREVEVLGLVADGLSDAEIAARLVVSPHTVHRHVANIRTKLGQRSRAAAVGEAARLELLPR